MQQTRGPQSLRVMQGLLHLAGKHPTGELEKAACVATHHGTWRLRDLKRLLALPGNGGADGLSGNPSANPFPGSLSY